MELSDGRNSSLSPGQTWGRGSNSGAEKNSPSPDNRLPKKIVYKKKAVFKEYI